MKIFGTRLVSVAGLVGAAGLFLNVNCGSSGGGGTGGTGGHAGTTGGTAGHAGTNGGTAGTNGGTAGTNGGTAGTNGGTAGTNGGTAGAGTAGTGGGTAGSGGAAAGSGGHAGGSGGAAAGSGGHAGGAGGSNTDGGTGTAAFSFTFDKNVEGFSLNTFNPSAGGNVADIDGGTKPTVTWDSTVGSPSSTPTGSLKLDVTFTDYNQFTLISSGTKPLINATGKTAQVWVLLDAVDGGHSFGGGVQLEANSGASFNGSANGAFTMLTAGTWKAVTLPLTASSSFDPSQVIQFSINVSTGSRPDGGTFAGPVHATFHIDTLTDGSGLPAPLPPNATFDLNTQGFVATASSHPDGGALPTVTFDSTIGAPNPGSIDVVLPFNGYNQGYTVQSDVAPVADLSGKTVHAQVMLDKVDGGTAAFPSGYVQLFVQSSGFKYANGAGKGLTAGVWTDLSLTVSTPSGMVSGYDPTQIIQVGVQFGTGGMPDGGVFGAATSPKFHIDSIVAQ